MRPVFFTVIILFLWTAFACHKKEANIISPSAESQSVNAAKPETASSPEPVKIPDLQAEILDDKNKTANSPLGKFDFKNYTYPLPKGWQGSGLNEITLEDGKIRASTERIGASLETIKYMDVTGDGQDEAFVVLKIDTGGSAVPQMVYIFAHKENEPELLWYFRTGDRADGGLKNFRVENGELVVELYGQDRYLAGELETLKITGDEEQICCPTFYTQSRYKQNGKFFKLTGKRLTYSIKDKTAPPIENMGEITEKREKKRGK